MGWKIESKQTEQNVSFESNMVLSMRHSVHVYVPFKWFINKCSNYKIEYNCLKTLIGCNSSDNNVVGGVLQQRQR